MALTVATPGGARFRVLHPIHCLESRVCNISLGGYTSPHAMRQLRASVICAAEFMHDLVDAGAYDRAFLRLAERIFHFSRNRAEAKRLFDEYSIDTLDAIPPRSSVNTASQKIVRFYVERHRRMVETLGHDRDRRRRDAENRARQAESKRLRGK